MLMLSITISAQEICNNAIDDDGDGLIDLQDTDCDCEQVLPSGLIPNESFEENDCIPMTETSTAIFPEIECLVDWIQAAPTSDYFHTDGIMYPTWINPTQFPPLPIPDGNGYLGFRDGRGNQPNYKEYVGACLIMPMEVGKTYTLDFFLGFPLSTNGIEMTIYGTTECSNLPFADQTNTGCPTNSPGWDQMDQTYIIGDTEWLNVVFDLYADKPYTAIILGPGCDPNPNSINHPYFFVDRLNLVEKIDEPLPFTEIEGSLCEESITLELDLGDEYDYQWYVDGIAIDGANSNEITIDVETANYGGYSVVITSPAGCVVSETLEITTPQYEEAIDIELCEGESFFVGEDQLTSSGVYTYMLTAVDGCDSLLTVDLTFLENAETPLSSSICEGESVIVAGQELTEEDVYFFTLPAANGCDSIITMLLTVDPTPVTMQSIDICSGESLTIDGDLLNTTGIYIYDYTLASGCDSTFVLDLTIQPSYSNQEQVTICEGESYTFGNEELTMSGIYSSDDISVHGCDSNVVLMLEVAPSTYGEVSATICDGDMYSLEGVSYSEQGTYELTTTNRNGCDSIINLDLSVIQYNDGVVLPPDTSIVLGGSLTIDPEYLDPAFVQYVWTDDEGNILSDNPNAELSNITHRMEVTLLAVDPLGCVDEDQIIIRVDRNIGIHTPNVFSPNGDGSNEYWRPKVNESIASLKEIYIYDRWGNLVYHDESIIELDAWLGWDGLFNGRPSIQGVYVYMATFTALDGVDEIISGDVTLIR